MFHNHNINIYNNNICNIFNINRLIYLITLNSLQNHLQITLINIII